MDELAKAIYALLNFLSFPEAIEQNGYSAQRELDHIITVLVLCAQTQ